jgi:hypothetical protein
LRRNRAILHSHGERSTAKLLKDCSLQRTLARQIERSCDTSPSAQGSRAQAQKRRNDLRTTSRSEPALHGSNRHTANFSRKEIVPGIESTYYRAMLEEAGASISRNITEHMNDHKISAAANADKDRVVFSKNRLSARLLFVLFLHTAP